MSLSIRAYARHRKAKGLTGGTHRAVQAAIADGRLQTSLTANGKQIASAELADAEWAATTHEDRIPLSGPTSQKDRAPNEAPAPAPSPLLDARTRREQIRVQREEFEFAREQGMFVRVDAARHDVMELFTIVRNRLLGLPVRMRQRDHTFTQAQYALMDELIREALEELADNPRSLRTASDNDREPND